MKRQLISSLLLVALVATYAVVFANGWKTEVGNATTPVSLGNSSAATMADGNPAPPFPPKKLKKESSATDALHQTPGWVMADGNPAPPFPPKKRSTIV